MISILSNYEESSPENNEEVRKNILNTIPKLNYDAVVELALYLAFEAKIHDHDVWMAIE